MNADHSVKFEFRTMGSRCVGERVIEEWIADTFRGMDISGFVISVNRRRRECHCEMDCELVIFIES